MKIPLSINKLSFFHKLIIGLAFSISTLILLLIISFNTSKKLLESYSLVEHTYQVKHKLEVIVLLLVKEESSTRKFVITGDTRSLWDFEENSKLINIELSKLSKMMVDNPTQIDRCIYLERLFQKRIHYLYQIVNLKRKNISNTHEMTQIMQEGSSYMSQIMLLKNRMELEEDLLLEKRKEKAAVLFNNTNNTILLAGIISVASIVLIVIILYKEKGKQNLIEKELKALNQNKNKFFSIISHDLRGPANGIVKLIEFLKDKNTTPEDIQHIVGLIENSSVKLVSLLENLLKWAKLQMDNFEFSPVQLDLKVVTESVIESLKVNASLKSITIENNLKHEMVMGDEEMIKTALRNILANSIKFTFQKGQISINSFTSSDAVSISIQDSGIGMSEETVNNLFKIGNTKSLKGTANETGSGLGLILCKEFIEKNKGSISIKSKINAGTTFIISFPKIE